jgi:hypothetical protein
MRTASKHFRIAAMLFEQRASFGDSFRLEVIEVLHVLRDSSRIYRAEAARSSFRPKGEIILRSLAFARDDRHWHVTLRLCEVNPLSEI